MFAKLRYVRPLRDIKDVRLRLLDPLDADVNLCISHVASPPGATELRLPSINLQVLLELPVRHVVRESLQLVAAHYCVRLNELFPEHLLDAGVRFQVRERLLERGGQLLL